MNNIVYMDIQKYANMSLDEYNSSVHLFKIQVLDVKITPIKWLDTVKNFKQKLNELNNDKYKNFIFYIDAKYIDILSNEQIHTIIDIFTENKDLFESKLICTLCYVEGVIFNLFKEIFNNFYNPIKPIKFLKTNTIDKEYIDNLLK